MRFIFGIIIGILLTFGAAYVTDSMGSAPGPDGKEARRMVNWDVVGDDMRGLSSGLQTLWAKLVGGAKQLDKQVDKPSNG